MFSIIVAFIEFIFYILIFVYLPKKSHYEYDYILEQIVKRSIYSYSDSYIDYFVENLKKSKNTNQAILGFVIILFISVIIRIILCIVHKCKRYKDNDIILLIRLSAFIGPLFIIISWILSLAIVAKVNKLRKKDNDRYGVTDTVKKNIVNVILILTADIIIGLIEVCSVSANYKEEETYSPSSYTPTVRYINSNNTNSNYQSNAVSTTTRTNIIVVRQEKKYIASLQRVLPYEVYSNLKNYIEKGKLILLALVKFYDEMKFEGLTDNQSITDEIVRIILILSALLNKMGDEVTKICIQFSHDEDALALLIQYLFPLIVRVIKLNIEKGIYRRCQRTTSEQIVVLTQLERTIERDEDGNVRQTFRFRQQVSQASLVKLLG